MSMGHPTLKSLPLLFMLVTAGCLGSADELGDVAMDTELRDHGLGDDGSDFVALTLAFEVAGNSLSSIPVHSVEAHGLPDGPTAFLSKPVVLMPGERRAVAALAVERGSALDGVQMTITVRDGLGDATLDVLIDRWDAKEDVIGLVRLTMPSLGVIEVAEVKGPVPMRALTPTSIPTYGYMAWPSGARQPLPNFPYIVHVPRGHPDFTAGQTARFVVDAPGETVRWHVGDDVVRGSVLEIEVERGRHTLEVEVGDGSARATLTVLGNVYSQFEGVAPAGTGSVRERVDGVNARMHELVIPRGLTHLSIVLAGAPDPLVATDLDLYLVGPDGRIVQESVTTGSADERLAIPGGIDTGDYELWVYNAEGLASAYRIDITMRF